MRVINIIVALVAVVASGGCKKVNSAYCDDTRPCGAGFACDLVLRECRVSDVAPADLGMPDLYSGCSPACTGITPICMMPTCLSCTVQADPEAACAALSVSTPHCAPDGACVGCRDVSDCTSPAAVMCDSTTHACRGCIADSECASLICELTPNAPARGMCVPMAQIIYADIANGADGNDGLTPATAKKTLQKALDRSTADNNHPFVRLAAGTYGSGATSAAFPVYIVGAPGTIIKPNSGDALGVSNGASMTVRGVIATAPGNGVNCGNANSKFTAYRSQFVDSLQIGVFGDNFCNITLDGCWVNNNAAGITVGGSFVIANTIITNNKGTGGFTQMAAGATQIFANNTVANNPSVSATAGGVTCVTGGPLVVNSILYGNTKAGGGIGETNCSVSYVATDDATLAPMSPNVDLRAQAPGFKPTPVPLSPDAFHLVPASPCKDKGTMSTGVPDHDFDFEPRPDKASMKVDIGADELQP